LNLNSQEEIKMASKKSSIAQIVLMSLSTLVNAGPQGTFAKLEEVQPLVDKGFAEVNNEIVDAEGRVAVRATPEGVASMNHPESEVPAAAENAKRQALQINIESDIPIPVAEGRGRIGSEKYPFSKLEIGQSFFVPNSETMPDAAKSLAGTASGAGKRNADIVDGVEVPRRFLVRSTTHQGVEGARVWRIEPKAPKAAE
jgi:hypothetical protein